MLQAREGDSGIFVEVLDDGPDGCELEGDHRVFEVGERLRKLQSRVSVRGPPSLKGGKDRNSPQPGVLLAPHDRPPRSLRSPKGP